MARAAKKRKKEDDDKVDIPEFDEVSYMEKEMQAARASFVLIALAILVAIVLYGITVVGVPIAAFFLGLALTFLLPRIFKVLPWPKIDVSKFERRDWIGHVGTFFFSWLAFWILILNVPFTDVTSPTIAAVSVNGVAVVGGGQQNLIRATSPIYLNATVLDNAGVASVELVVSTNGTSFQFVRTLELRWSIGVIPGSTFNNAVIVATDTAGRSSEFLFDLQLS